MARDAQGTLIGGLNGVCHWRWLYVRHLWVDRAATRRGWPHCDGGGPKRLAKDRGCVGIMSTRSIRRLAAFYEDIGFARAGEIVGFPPGHQRLFFRKSLE